MSTKTNKDISSKIIEAVVSQRKMSERFIGFVPYNITVHYHLYNGVSHKPEKISVFEKTIVKIINKGVTKVRDIAQILGLDYSDSVEATMVQEAIRNIKTNLGLIDGGSHYLEITPEGKNYLRTGVCVKKYTRNFKICFVPGHLSFTTLDSVMTSEIKGRLIDGQRSPLNLDDVRRFAASQASHMEDSEMGISLQQVTLSQKLESIYPVHVCFLQSIKDNTIRTLVYDQKNDNFVDGLSSLFNEEDFIKELLPKCLKNEVKSQSLEETDSGEKEKEQVQAEKKLIEIDENPENQEKIDDYNLIVGSSFNTPEFESQLREIFEKHKNQEIWLISPWIKKYAFLTAREPMIRKFLDQGGAIFIGYSAPERDGEDMVDSSSMNVLKRLNDNYDKFYFAELPKFHIKNVIEFKNDVTILYSGSFNVLSFCINNTFTHYRQEEMTVANLKNAELKRHNFLKMFADKYVLETTSKITNSQSGDYVNISKLDYLNSLGIVHDAIARIEEKAKSNSINIVKNQELSKEDYFEISKKVLEFVGDTEDQYYVQAILSSCLFQFSFYTERNEINLADSVLQKLYQKLLGRRSFFLGRTCRFSMRKGRNDSKKTILSIVCNGFNFEFGEISLPKSIFKSIFEKREMIYFKDENIQLARYSTNERILYNSAKSLGVLDYN